MQRRLRVVKRTFTLPIDPGWRAADPPFEFQASAIKEAAMNIVCVDAVRFGVEDLDACRRFLRDLGGACELTADFDQMTDAWTPGDFSPRNTSIAGWMDTASWALFQERMRRYAQH
jgi:hypothetical protein